RFSRSARARRCRAGRARLEAAPQPLPLPRLSATGVARSRTAAPALGTRARQLSLVGRPVLAGRGRARGVAPAGDRRLRPRSRRVRRAVGDAPRKRGHDVDRLSPYKGLAPFEDSEHDASFFFGRTREQEIVTANLTAARLTLLYGLSGVGKSSILRAGVVRRLRALPGPLEVVVFDQWRDDPGRRLRDAVAAPVECEAGVVDAVRGQVARGQVDLGVTGRGIANGGRNGEYVETPYLSLVMERLWAAERESGVGVLRLRTLESLGGAEQIVRDH